MRRRLWALALGLLVIIDAALVAWALRPANDSAQETPVASSSGSTTAASSSSSSSTAAKPDRVIVLPANSTSAWRVVTGSSCSGAVSVARSQDVGATWTSGPKVDLKMVSSVSADASGAPVLTGLDAACKPTTVLLQEAGVKPADNKPVWAINPADASTLLHAGKATAKACPAGTIKDLAADTDERANVLCDGGEVRRTTDTGATWSKVGTVKGATGISTASAGQGYRLYVASDQSCGVRVAAIADEAAGSASACVEGSAGSKGVDIAVWGRSIWVADQTKAWVVPTSNSAVAQTSSSTAQSSTAQSSTESFSESSTSSTQEPSSTSNPVVPSSSTQQWTPSSTSQWTPPRTRTSTYEPPSSTFTPPVEPTTVEPPVSQSTANPFPSGLATVPTGQ